MDNNIKRKNSRLINLSYIGSVVAYLIGWYFITQGYLLAFIGVVPTLIFGLNLIKKGEMRYGLVLILFFFVWITVYYSYLPGQSLNR